MEWEQLAVLQAPKYPTCTFCHKQITGGPMNTFPDGPVHAGHEQAAVTDPKLYPRGDAVWCGTHKKWEKLLEHYAKPTSKGTCYGVD